MFSGADKGFWSSSEELRSDRLEKMSVDRLQIHGPNAARLLNGMFLFIHLNSKITFCIKK